MNSEQPMVPEKPIGDALGELRDRLTRLEVKHGYTEASVGRIELRIGDMAATQERRWEELDAKMDARFNAQEETSKHITSMLENLSGAMAAGKWILGFVGTIALGLAGIFSQFWKH